MNEGLSEMPELLFLMKRVNCSGVKENQEMDGNFLKEG